MPRENNLPPLAYVPSPPSRTARTRARTVSAAFRSGSPGRYPVFITSTATTTTTAGREGYSSQGEGQEQQSREAPPPSQEGEIPEQQTGGQEGVEAGPKQQRYVQAGGEMPLQGRSSVEAPRMMSVVEQEGGAVVTMEEMHRFRVVCEERVDGGEGSAGAKNGGRVRRFSEKVKRALSIGGVKNAGDEVNKK